MKLPGFILFLFLGLFALLFLFLLKLGLQNVWRGIASTRWPVADAVVTKVEATVQPGSGTGSRRSGPTYGTRLTLRYKALGQFHTTDQVTWGQILGSGDPSEAALLAYRYPEGLQTRVHYNPSDPSQAVVLPGLHATAFLLPGAALIFLLALAPAFLIGRDLFSTDDAGTRPGPQGAMDRGIRIFLLVPALMGTGLFVAGVQNVLHGWQSTRWPTTEGQWVVQDPDTTSTPVTESPSGSASTDATPSVEGAAETPGTPNDGTPPASTPDQGSPPTEISPPEPPRGAQYIYRYSVRGRTHYNNIIQFGQGSARSQSLETPEGEPIPRNATLTVAYHPADPDLAVLQPGLVPLAWVLPAAGAGFLAFSVIGLLILSSQHRQAPEPDLEHRPTGSPLNHRGR